jgi:hypothetical protein
MVEVSEVVWDEAPQGVVIESLETSGNNPSLKDNLIRSNGSALIVVHPYFHDATAYAPGYPEKDLKIYEEYKERLKVSVSRYKELGLPTILLEEFYRIDSVGQSLQRMGIEDGTVYLVPTDVSSSNPLRTSLENFVDELKESGLKKAVVLGSYMWFRDYRLSIFDIETAPRIASKHQLDGCAGHTVATLLEAGVRGITGMATYPRAVEPPNLFDRFVSLYNSLD